MRRVDGVPEHAPRRVDGVRDAAMAREQTRVESVAATAWGPEAVDAAERPRERAGLRETGQAAAAPRAPRERDVADGGADSRAQSSPVRHRHEVERAAEDATRPKPPWREQTADAGPRDHNATTPKTKKTHTGPRHPRPPKTTKTHVDVLRVLSGDVGRFTLYGRRGAGLGHSRGELDRAVRPAGRPARVRP